jgi:hypothetical protein
MSLKYNGTRTLVYRAARAFTMRRMKSDTNELRSIWVPHAMGLD